MKLKQLFSSGSSGADVRHCDASDRNAETKAEYVSYGRFIFYIRHIYLTEIPPVPDPPLPTSDH